MPVFLFLFVFISSFQVGEWRLDKDKDGIKVFTREAENYSIREFRVEASTSASLEVIERLFKGVDTYSTWMPDIEEASVIEQVTDDIFIYHMAIGAPFPVANRDLVTEMRFSYPSENILRIDYNVLPDHIPEKEDHVRMRYFSGHWQFSRKEATTFITNQFLSDPGGSIPNWVTNSFLSKNPFNTVKKLKEQVE